MTTKLSTVFLTIVFIGVCNSEQDFTLPGRKHDEEKAPKTDGLYSQSETSKRIHDRDIKLAYMKEILNKLGMKDRPPPIPLDKRKQNIPRPVYDGGINIASQDLEQAKETQIVIAAEEGEF